jgi:transmembrane sensor
MKNREAKKLLDKYKSATVTQDEKAYLDSWYINEAKSKNKAINHELMQAHLDEVWEKLPGKGHEKSSIRHLMIKGAVAATVLLLLATGLLFYYRYSSKLPVFYANKHSRQDIPPGRNRAILVLANGKKIDLDAIKKGAVVHQNGLTITKANNGQLIYAASVSEGQSLQKELSFNTIETPKGGCYSIILPDGTTVWLNAASALKYPIQFSNRERRVELTGEGYFEVAHDKTKPFKVITSTQEIEVLGTHFNVNAYTDENETKTTLLEGSVKLKTKQAENIVQRSVVLKPGQQSSLNNTGLEVTEVNVDDAIAWQKGYFKFNRESIQNIMRKLSRWYNIEVVFETKKDPLLLFGGKISQTKNLQAVLQIIEETGNVHFSIEGRRVIVMQ